MNSKCSAAQHARLQLGHLLIESSGGGTLELDRRGRGGLMRPTGSARTPPRSCCRTIIRSWLRSKPVLVANSWRPPRNVAQLAEDDDDWGRRANNSQLDGAP